MKTVYKKNIMDMGDLLTDEEKEKCCRLIDLVPDRDTFVSRGFEPQNLLYQNNALFLSDFTYSGYGHPLFDLADLSVSLASTSESNLSEDFMARGPFRRYPKKSGHTDLKRHLSLRIPIWLSSALRRRSRICWIRRGFRLPFIPTSNRIPRLKTCSTA